MADRDRFFQTTAIDYPNSRPHIGTAFEKIGADVQARYRRMEGYEVFFLMGNDENTIKVARRAAELGQSPKAYCDDMAGQFQEVWRALEISFDDFIQTSEPRHHEGCRTFIQKVFDNGHIFKGPYEGWYCQGCEEFKTEKQAKENNGTCPNHKTPLLRGRHRAAAHRVRAWLRLSQERDDGRSREDRQGTRERDRADGCHHEVQRRGVSLLLLAQMSVSRRWRVRLGGVRQHLQRRPGE